jgi:hypothetical protein
MIPIRLKEKRDHKDKDNKDNQDLNLTLRLQGIKDIFHNNSPMDSLHMDRRRMDHNHMAQDTVQDTVQDMVQDMVNQCMDNHTVKDTDNRCMGNNLCINKEADDLGVEDSECLLPLVLVVV